MLRISPHGQMYESSLVYTQMRERARRSHFRVIVHIYRSLCDIYLTCLGDALGISSHTATHCNTLQHTFSEGLTTTLQLYTNDIYIPRGHLGYLGTQRNTLQHTATHCNTLQHTFFEGLDTTLQLCTNDIYLICLGDTLGISSQHTTQHTATHCNTLQHTATYVFSTALKRLCTDDIYI